MQAVLADQLVALATTVNPLSLSLRLVVLLAVLARSKINYVVVHFGRCLASAEVVYRVV